MTQPPIAHGTFTIERVYPASPERVFHAWSDPETKARWFIGPEDWTEIARELDFAVGGIEILRGRFPNGLEPSFTARYHHIVINERIVYDYDMHMGQRHHSTSLATVELRPASPGTRLIFTEQVAFLDGTDGASGTASRQRGTEAHLDRIGQQFR